MLINKSVLAIASIALVCFSTVCAADDVQAARATVTGPENRLVEFHKNLLGFTPESDFQDAPIVCSIKGVPAALNDCSKLSRNETVSRSLEYIFLRDHERLEALVLAWGKLQAANLDPFVTIKFDTVVPPSDCSALPQPCVSAPFCKATPGCDKYSGAPCQKCQ